MPSSVNITQFIEGPLKYGISYADNYELNIYADFTDTDTRNITLLCKDTNWPSYLFNLGEVHGINLGENEKRFPYTDTTNELEATFIVDKDLKVLKFFSDWFNRIYPNQQRGLKSQIRRFAYPSTYQSIAILSKLEKEHENHIKGAIIFNKFFPYSREISPISYSKTEPMEITMRFTYESYVEKYEAITPEERARLIRNLVRV